MRLRVCNGSPHRGRNKWFISVRRAREQWLVGIINYMRVIGTINDRVSKTGRTTYAHCPLPVGGIECDRRHNLVSNLLFEVENLRHFDEISFNIMHIFIAWV